ncbi:hypothetical protein H4I96_12289 [Botrytis cinerea]
MADEEMFQLVKLQCWFGTKRGRFWIVDEAKGQEQERQVSRAMTRDVGEETDDSGDGNDDSEKSESDQDDIEDQIVQDIEKWKGEAQERRLRTLKEVPVVEIDSWLRYTKWNEVLSQSKHNLVETSRYTRMPDPEEPQLERLLYVWNRILERCLNTLEAIDHKDTLKWWASPKNEAADQRPFEIPQNAQSVDKYSRIFACFICYMMRTAPLENHTDETETGVRYTNAQWKCIQRIRNKLDENTPADDETEDRSLINALMCLSVRGVDEQSQSLRSAFCYTPILAGMLWVNRLIMLEVAVPCEPWPELQLHSKADVDSVRDRIHQLRALHLCEGSFSPTSSILTQLAMGKKFNKIHQSPSNIHWSDDEQTINYLGQPVVLAKIERMCHTLIGELQALMNVLTFGSPVPPIDLSRIVDSMAWSQAFRRQNFSFITHAQNQDQVRGDYGFLLERARRKGGGWRLLQTNPTTKKVEWVDSQVTAYLTKERQFLRKLMVCMHITVRVRPFARALDHRESEYLFGDLRGPWAGEELSQALGSATRKHLGVYLRASGWRHTAIGIATRYLMRASKTWEKEHEDPEDGGDEFAEGDDDEELELDTFRHIMVRQSGHGRRVAQAHYAIDGAFLHRLGPELITAYEQASTAWHGLWKLSSHGVGSRNSSRIGGVSHRRDASQQLSNRIIKRGRIESSDPALVGLQRIYHDPQAKPRSEGQASALQLVHHPSTTQPLVIVLPTSSGKSALFFSVAAMTEQQTVVVVVPFAALVDDIIERGRAAGLDCTEWIDETSGHELSQLIVVSADRAVQGPFLHYAKGLELGGQLAHVFFDEVHVAFTDTSYRERLRDLWTLRYLDCPFTGLTATNTIYRHKRRLWVFLCQYAQRPIYLCRHLSDQHRVPIKLRKQLEEYIKEYPFQYDYTNIQLPSDSSAPQPIIPVLDGYKCQSCQFKTHGRDTARQHCNKVHNQKRMADEEMFQLVKLQCWFGTKRGRFWIVDEAKGQEQERQVSRAMTRDVGEETDDSGDGNDDSEKSESDQDDIEDQIVQDIEKWKGEAQERRLRTLKEVPVVEIDSWLRYTKWNEVLSQSKHNLVETSRYTRMPDPEEPQLERLLYVWNRILERCLNTLEAIDHKDTLKWWASPKNEAADQRPFEIPQNAQSVDKYSRIFACFICYMMRTAPLENHTDETETGVRYTNAQWKCIQRIRNKLDENTPADDETEDRSLINALMCLSVRGVDEQSQSLRSAFCYTPILAGMLWVNRLIMLEVAVPCEPWPELQLHSKADVDSVRDRIHQLRALHLCEGSFSPTSSILTQLAMGKKFNKIHQSPSNIHWSDDEQTINYLGQPVVLAKIERMCHTLIGELQALMNVLTFGSPVPPIDLSRIVDSMAWSQAFRRQNFSFITHAQNQDQVRGDYGFLLERARRKGGGWRLLQTNPTTKKVEWVDSQVTAYLTKERQFLRKLMVCMHITVRVRPFARALDHRESEYLFGDLRGPWAGEELSQALGSATRKHLGVYLRASGWRHTAIGIATRYLMRASKTWEKEHEDPEDGGDEFAEGDDDEELELDTFRHIMVRQSGHGRRVAQAHYAIDGAFLHRLGPELITAYEQASTAWHGLWKLSSHGVGSRNSSRIGGVSHRRDASQQLSNRIIKRGRIESSDPALVGLQRIYHDPQAKPRSEGQASALQLVHHPSTTQPLVIVLPTSSGKSALFFSVAAMTEQQTVVVVVPFAALVDDIIERGRAAGLDCTEWIDETSGHELSQLIVVSADRAVQGPFLHYAKGLELGGQLAHVFFDEVHVAFTDTSYRERLRDLWTLRYLDCPFTGLTATNTIYRHKRRLWVFLCQYAQRPIYLCRHLSDQHRVPIKLRKQLEEYIKEYPFQYDYTNIQLPSDSSAPQPIIPVLDGYKCQSCQFKTHGRDTARQHCNKVHNQKRMADEEMFQLVKLQCWFGTKRGRFWIVDEAKGQEQERQVSRAMTRDVGEETDDSGDGNDDSEKSESDQDDIEDQIVQDIEKWKGEAQERRLRTLKEVPVVEIDSWLRYTKWNEVLSQSKHNLVETSRYTRMPDPEEPQLERLLYVWNRILERCLNTLEAIDHKDTLKWWASPKNEAADQRPFEIPQNAQSVDKYSRIFACFICYMMRTAPLENHTDETETGVRYTNAQWKCIQRIRNKLDENTPADDETEDRSLINALMCLSVRGVDEQSQSLRSAFCYTPILAGMLWVNRLIMLEVAVPCEPWPELQLHSKADVDSVRDRIHQLRALHLCEGSFSPTSSILTQLAMGKKFNKIHQSPSNIHWSDDEQTINYLGQPVVLAKIERMCHTLIGELQALMNVLTFGSPVPPIDLSRIVDSMAWSQAFRRQNFSFITHAQNQDQVRGDYGFLLERARRKGGGWRLLQTNPTTKKVEWVDSQVTAYLTKERQFLRKLMVCMHITVRVRPFARALDHRESEYLFGDLRGPWAGEELSQALGSATRKHLGVYLRASGWRHTAIGIATRYLMRASKTWEKEHEDPEDGGDEFAEGDDDEELELDTFRHIMVRQSGHGRRVAQAHYAIDGAFLHRLGPELITAYEQASTAWHGLWKLSSHGVGSRNSSRIGGVSHRRDASQQLSNRIIKRGRIESSDPALVGLQRIYHDPQAKPRSEGQASALQLVHHPSTTQPLVIVLPTSSGKSALFFSVAAMTEQQTVVVVVPFAALVDDIIERGRAAGLDCTEWIDETSGHELSQLIVVSADRAVQGPFLHYAKGLELGGQLAHVFFDEVHVAFTDTSYRERLRDLWTLRYLDCPFTGLTATLIVDLEDVLRERLCIDNAQIFRRSTARKTIRYQVRDSKYTAPSEVAIAYVQRTRLSAGKRGVIYVRSYETGRAVSDALACPFYRARAELKGEVLQQWVQGPGGWIVATGALGTGINIEGIIYVVHVGRPYGLTSFVQQSGRGGRNGEVSESIIITRVEHSRGRRRREIMSEYSVEQIDEDAMTEFIQAPGCRRQVLGRYMDGTTSGNNCSQTDSVLCDQCWNGSRARGRISTAARHEREVGTIEERTAITGADIIQRRLGQVEASQEQMMAVMDRLQGDCIYCGLMKKEHARGRAHAYQDCLDAVASGCGRPAYQAWREKIDLGSFQHCWKCGLSQRICRRLEDDGWCEYPEVMLPGIFILHQQQHLPAIVEAAGFHGDYTADIWEWLQEVGEGFGRDWESNWMKTWRMACEIYARMMEEGVST